MIPVAELIDTAMVIDRIDWFLPVAVAELIDTAVVIDRIDQFLPVAMAESINTAVVIRCTYLLAVLLDGINWFHLIWEYNTTINTLGIRDPSWLH